jgi:hypothetical protein
MQKRFQWEVQIAAKKYGLKLPLMDTPALYSSDENVCTVKDKEVDIISPPIGNEKKYQLSLGDFHL